MVLVHLPMVFLVEPCTLCLHVQVLDDLRSRGVVNDCVPDLQKVVMDLLE